MGTMFLESLAYVEPIGTALALLYIFRAREHKTYHGLTFLLSVRFVSNLVCIGLIQLCHSRIFPRTVTYPFYFYTYWGSFAVEACLAFYMVLNIFRVAMAPLEGLRKLGMLIFQWAAAISVILATVLSISPFKSTATLLSHFLTAFQQVSSVITLCLLLFVCFAIRPLGLNLRSRVFGVALGLGLTSTASLAQAAWFSPKGSLYTTANLIAAIGGAMSLLVWSAYFALPEPKRRIIVLPTTSPFLRWNQISEVLGDNPGYVAIAGVPPELFAPAEIEVMIRASIKMKDLELETERSAADISLSTLSA